jgi:mycothiol maleylpyruvate isomerase-like protein
MTDGAPIRDAYLSAAESAAALLRDPAVAASWQQPSALPEFAVSGLAGHLANQTLSAEAVLAVEGGEAPISLLDHYERVTWRGAEPDAEVNVHIRSTGERLAADGADALADRVDATIKALADWLAAAAPDRTVHLPWGPWSLTLDDFLVTRMMEIAVHSDDLAVSVGVSTPPLPADVLDPVFALLTDLAVREHGPVAVLRALSRAERAPRTIAGI